MRFFCPRCWNDFPNDLPACPSCGLDIPDFWRGKDYAAKLIAALCHPDTETVMRAATILGDLHEKTAVDGLIELAKTTSNVYVASAAVDALGKIGTPQACAYLAGVARSHRAGMVRDAARCWVKLEGENGPCPDRRPAATSVSGEKAGKR